MSWSELDRIEATYGSVAEYNRVMEEEYEYDDFGNMVPRKHWEPSEEEIERQQRELEEYNNLLDWLCGETDKDTEEFYQSLKEQEPKREDFGENGYNNYCNASYAYHEVKRDKVMEFIKNKYGLTFNEKVSQFHPEPGTFIISIDVTRSCHILHYSIRDLDYDTFARIFNDLYSLRVSPFFSVQCKDMEDDMMASHVSLGEIRRNYIAGHDGFPTIKELEQQYKEYKEKSTVSMNSIASMMSGE